MAFDNMHDMHQDLSMDNYEDLVNPTYSDNLRSMDYAVYPEVRGSGSGSAQAFGESLGVRSQLDTPSTIMGSENPFDDVYSGRATRGGVSDDDGRHENFGERRGGDGDGSRMEHIDDDTSTRLFYDYLASVQRPSTEEESLISKWNEIDNGEVVVDRPVYSLPATTQGWPVGWPVAVAGGSSAPELLLSSSHHTTTRRDRSSGSRPPPLLLPHTAGTGTEGVGSTVHAHAHYDADDANRVDLNVRNMLREMLVSAILSENSTVQERIMLLEDCRYSAMSSDLGIPFREILSERMEPFGVPALMYELGCCRPVWMTRPEDSFEVVAYPDLGTGLELVQYLIENWQDRPTAGNMGNMAWVVRTGCLKRSDEDSGNRLFQALRPFIGDNNASTTKSEGGGKYEEYDISVSPLDGHKVVSDDCGFKVLISLPKAYDRLSQLEEATVTVPGPSTSRFEPGRSYDLQNGRKPLPPVPKRTSIGIEFLAAKHAWRLKIGRNSLGLELVDGPSGYSHIEPSAWTSTVAPLKVDAAVEVIGFKSKGESSGLFVPKFFLPRAELKPLTASGRGTHATRVKPCFCATPGERYEVLGFDDPRLLQDDGTLLLELCVRLGSRAPVLSSLPVQTDEVAVTPRGMPQACSSSSLARAEADFVTTVCENTRTDPSREKGLDGIEDDYDDLYVSSEDEGEARTGRDEKDEDHISSIEDWEEVSTMDELSDTETKDGAWVKTGWKEK